MNGYKAFYKGKELDVYAETSFIARQKAVAEFKAKKQWEVAVYICERDTDGTEPGEQVYHRAVD